MDWLSGLPNMRCPTCGKQVAKGQEVCSYCGALVADRSHPRASDLPAPTPQEPGRLASQKAAPRETVTPSVMEMEEVWSEAVAPLPPYPPEAAPAPSKVPRPALPSWVRWIVPLIFFLIPLLQLLLRDSPWIRWSSPRPVLSQSVFCEKVTGSRPVNPKTVFSLREDRQVVFFGRWDGRSGGHTYSLRWYAPNGTPRAAPALTLRSQSGGEGFITYAVLPLESSFPVGQWRVEVFMDEEVVGRLRFELRE